MFATKLGRTFDGKAILLLAGVAAIGVMVVALSGPSRQVGPSGDQALPTSAAQACQGPASLEKGGSLLTFSWHLVAEVDKPQGSAVLYVSGTNTLLCQVGRNADGHFAEVATAIGGHPGDNRVALTMDGGADTPAGKPSILAGRLPLGTTTVRIVFGDGSESSAVVGGGNYLAWFDVPGIPVRIEALDAGGRVLEHLADPNGLSPG